MNMESKPEEEKNVLDSRLQNILNSLSRCKIDFTNENEECRKLREANSKLEVELKEVREMEKSHRYHLLTSREMIGNLQETVSQLVYLKREMKKMKEQLSMKESNIADVEKDKENVIQKQNDNIMKLRSAYEKQIEDMKSDNKREIQQIQNECDAQVAQFTCAIEELRAKMREMEAEHREKINVLVLEYEEKIQREAARVVQLQEELARETARTDLNIDAYRRRLEELEEKLKQSQFKQYLQNSYPSQYENHVERPYSANREPYTEYHSIDSDPVQDIPTTKFAMPSQTKAPKPNSLQVIYYDKNVAETPKPKSSEKKGLFHITKKRKLYNDKDFQDF
ncbi:tropomyosin-2-like isoform X1 [Spodoptera frugiperda]|uniref:Tropomyosin-2-like isoform X1 n=1 Tax=Spodoptera frugiperda TaxID=7108 RepID=A0A9R0E5U4_SPOFR|nr:tropomyosin-2-like isoform X2 [Spodoptera frugiperda]XP_050558951.1 tropomyosin-2-like isoform X1 [Spodoptera frugiperda]